MGVKAAVPHQQLQFDVLRAHSLLLLRVEPGMNVCAREGHAFIGVGEGFRCVWGRLSTVLEVFLGLRALERIVKADVSIPLIKKN
jgi:hypothetical protein